MTTLSVLYVITAIVIVALFIYESNKYQEKIVTAHILPVLGFISLNVVGIALMILHVTKPKAFNKLMGIKIYEPKKKQEDSKA